MAAIVDADSPDTTKLQHLADGIHVRHLAGIFLLSLSTLLLELSLPRILSVTLWYHFSFLVISTALLGFGAAGVTLAVSDALRQRAPLNRSLGFVCIAFGITTLVSFWVLQHIPFDPLRLLSDGRQLLLMPVYYIVIATPFYCSGLAIALELTRGTRSTNRLYAFDLVGAGLGCMAIVVTLPALDGPGAVALAATLGFVAAAVFAARTSDADGSERRVLRSPVYARPWRVYSARAALLSSVTQSCTR